MTEERLGELYAGALMLVAERGYDNVTMDRIAEATKCSKATLYRQWGGKAELVVEALSCTGKMQQEWPDTGSLRGDLTTIAASKDARGDDDSELISAIMHAMRQNEELAQAVRTQILDPARERIRLLLQRAVDRGEIAADCPVLAHADLLFMAPMVLRPLLDGATPDARYLTDYFEDVLLPALGVS